LTPVGAHDPPEESVTMIIQLASAPTEHILASHFVLSGMKDLFLLVGGIVAAILCAVIAKAKGYSALLFAILGFFFSILTLIVVIVIPRRTHR
jgi:hypothetical protein